VKKKKTWKGKKGLEKGPAQDFTGGRVINQRDQKIQYFVTSIRVAAHSGAGSKFDDEEQARVLKREDCGATFSQDKGDVTLNG